MKNKIYTLYFFLFATATFFLCDANAQNLDSLNISNKKVDKKYRFNLQLNYAKKSFLTDAKYSYEGEYYNSVNSTWEWTEKSGPKLEDGNRYNHLSLQASIGDLVKNFNFGLSYHVNFLQSQNKDTIVSTYVDYYTGEVIIDTFYNNYEQNNVFFAIAGVVEYEYQVKPIPNLYVIPTISIGTYQSDIGVFTGKGLEFFADYRLSIMYKIKNKIGLNVFTSYSGLNYKYKTQSKIFPERTEITKSDVQFFKLGFGLSYQFDLIPD